MLRESSSEHVMNNIRRHRSETFEPSIIENIARGQKPTQSTMLHLLIRRNCNSQNKRVVGYVHSITAPTRIYLAEERMLQKFKGGGPLGGISH